eukprot:GHVT01041548.1.p1 GENE.GHVT01041548.1~~GHVT01041548.1.p1  ORF type:complete len:787 (+),score=42.20 GHVT01041548.1:4090-6450(+)
MVRIRQSSSAAVSVPSLPYNIQEIRRRPVGPDGPAAPKTRSRIAIQNPFLERSVDQIYDFDHIFQPHDSQSSVFTSVAKPLVNNVLRGFNSSCFAYGQTGSGKTFSMFGSAQGDNRGLISRSLEYLFEQLRDTTETHLEASYLELYLDQLRDLACPLFRHAARQNKSKHQACRERYRAKSQDACSRHNTAQRTGRNIPEEEACQFRRKRSCANAFDQPLRVCETRDNDVHVEGLTTVPLESLEQAVEFLQTSCARRETHTTCLNAVSSRSHAIFTVYVTRRHSSPRNNNYGHTTVQKSCLNFVDLAGSERLRKSHSEGRRFQEAVSINSSLSALGKVMLSLALASGGSEQSDNGLQTLRPGTSARHVPFRDSKLTRVLQNSLGGRSFTCLLACIYPTIRNYEETLNTLAFAERCTRITLRPREVRTVAEDRTTGVVDNAEAVETARLLAEIRRLQEECRRVIPQKSIPFAFDPEGAGAEIASVLHGFRTGIPNAQALMRLLERDMNASPDPFEEDSGIMTVEDIYNLLASSPLHELLVAHREIHQRAVSVRIDRREGAERHFEKLQRSGQNTVANVRKQVDRLEQQLQQKEQMLDEARANTETLLNGIEQRMGCFPWPGVTGDDFFDISTFYSSLRRRVFKIFQLSDELSQVDTESIEPGVPVPTQFPETVMGSTHCPTCGEYWTAGADNEDRLRKCRLQHEQLLTYRSFQIAQFRHDNLRRQEEKTTQIEKLKEESRILQIACSRLSDIIADCRNGKYPITLKAGVRSYVIPREAIPSLPSLPTQ